MYLILRRVLYPFYLVKEMVQLKMSMPDGLNCLSSFAQLPKQVILSHSGALCQPLVEKDMPRPPSIQKQETKSSLS